MTPHLASFLAAAIALATPAISLAQSTAAIHLDCGEDQTVDEYGTGVLTAADCASPNGNAGASAHNKTMATRAWANTPGGLIGGGAISRVVNADYLVLKGAPDGGTTKVRFEWTLKGATSPNGSILDVVFQAGVPPADSCGANDAGFLLLPEPVNVNQALVAFTHQSGQGKAPRSGSVELDVYGNNAVVPVLGCVQAIASTTVAPDGVTWLPASTDYTVTVKMTLPPGISCRSRSGVAFQGLCKRIKA